MKKILSILLIVTILFSGVNVFAQFNDIDDLVKSWAGEAIDALFEKGIINGYEDGSFRPHGNVTKAEFAKMLVMSFKGGETKKEFTDTKGHWAEKYIDSAAGFMYCPESEFAPDTDATRADIAYAASKALGLSKSANNYADKFSDFNLLKEDMKEAVSSAIDAGIIIGYEDSTLKGESSVTRAEAAVIIYRALNISVKDENTQERPNENLPLEDENKNEKDHIYTLYPGRDFILIENVTKTNIEKKGEECYRLTYRLANSEKKYSSLIPADVEVKGLRNSVEAICPGDVLIMSTAFHGYIGYLHVMASFDEAVPAFDSPYSDTVDYTAFYGKVIDVKSTRKAVILTIDNGSEVKDATILKTTDINLYSSWAKGDKWTLGDTGDIDLEKGDTYVFIRFTEGVSTDIVVNNIRK